MLRPGMRVERKDNRLDPTDEHVVPPGTRGTIVRFPVTMKSKLNPGRLVDAAHVRWDVEIRGPLRPARDLLTERIELLIPLEDE